MDLSALARIRDLSREKLPEWWDDDYKKYIDNAIKTILPKIYTQISNDNSKVIPEYNPDIPDSIITIKDEIVTQTKIKTPFLFKTKNNTKIICNTENTVGEYIKGIYEDINRQVFYVKQNIKQISINKGEFNAKNILINLNELINNALQSNFEDKKLLDGITTEQIEEIICNCNPNGTCVTFSTLEIKKMTEPQVNFIKKALYNILVIFQSYISELTKLLTMKYKILENEYNFKSIKPIIYFDIPNKSIITIYKCTGREEEDPENILLFGYVINVFYINDINSFSYNYVDFTNPTKLPSIVVRGGNRKTKSNSKSTKYKKSYKNKNKNNKNKNKSTKYRKSYKQKSKKIQKK